MARTTCIVTVDDIVSVGSESETRTHGGPARISVQEQWVRVLFKVFSDKIPFGRELFTVQVFNSSEQRLYVSMITKHGSCQVEFLVDRTIRAMG